MLSNFPFDFFFNPWILEMGLHSFWMFGYFPEIFLLLLSDSTLLWTEKTLWIHLKNLSGYAWVLSAHSTAWKKLLSSKLGKSSRVLLSTITFCCYLRSSILKPIVSYILLYFSILLRQEGESESCQSILAGNRSLKFVWSITSFEWTF